MSKAYKLEAGVSQRDGDTWVDDNKVVYFSDDEDKVQFILQRIMRVIAEAQNE